MMCIVFDCWRYCAWLGEERGYREDTLASLGEGTKPSRGGLNQPCTVGRLQITSVVVKVHGFSVT